MIGTIVAGCMCATSWCDLGATFDLGPAKMFLLLCLRHIPRITKVYELLQLIIILLCYLNWFLYFS